MATNAALATRRNIALVRLGQVTGREFRGQGSKPLGMEAEAILFECLADSLEKIFARLGKLESRPTATTDRKQ